MRALLDTLMRHAQRFRYRFLIVRLDESGAEIACCSFRRELAESLYAPRCSFRLVLERREEVFVITEWLSCHSCTASYRVRQSVSHDFLTDSLLVHALGADATRASTPVRSSESLGDILRAAEARGPESAPFLTAEDLLSFDRPPTPPSVRRGFVRARAATFHTMGDLVGSHPLQPGAWRYARGEHGSLDDLRRSHVSVKRRSSSATDELRAVLTNAARNGYIIDRTAHLETEEDNCSESSFSSWAERGETPNCMREGCTLCVTPPSTAGHSPAPGFVKMQGAASHVAIGNENFVKSMGDGNAERDDGGDKAVTGDADGTHSPRQVILAADGAPGGISENQRRTRSEN